MIIIICFYFYSNIKIILAIYKLKQFQMLQFWTKKSSIWTVFCWTLIYNQDKLNYKIFCLIIIICFYFYSNIKIILAIYKLKQFQMLQFWTKKSSIWTVFCWTLIYNQDKLNYLTKVHNFFAKTINLKIFT